MTQVRAQWDGFGLVSSVIFHPYEQEERMGNSYFCSGVNNFLFLRQAQRPSPWALIPLYSIDRVLCEGGRMSRITATLSDLVLWLRLGLWDDGFPPTVAGRSGFNPASIFLIRSVTALLRTNPALLPCCLCSTTFLANCFEYLRCHAKRRDASLSMLSIQKF